MTQPRPPRPRGTWSGAATWDDAPSPERDPAAAPAAGPDAAAPTAGSERGRRPDESAADRLAQARAALARAEGSAGDAASARAETPTRAANSVVEAAGRADGQPSPGQAAAEVDGPAPGVPDFLPPGADVPAASWDDLRTEASRGPATRGRRRGRGTHGDHAAGPDARDRRRRAGADRPRRKGRAEDPPTAGAAAADAEPDPEDVARQIVLRQLAMAPRSRAQLEEKLRQRDCPEDVIGRVLDRMTEVGLVDDEAYAAMLVRSRQATKGLARRALAQELRRRGIDKELADLALEEVDESDERRTARQLVDKRLRTMGGLAVEVQTRRLAGMLARKGYPAGLAYAVIRDAIADAPEHQRD